MSLDDDSPSAAETPTDSLDSFQLLPHIKEEPENSPDDSIMTESVNEFDDMFAQKKKTTVFKVRSRSTGM
jgi:hypothetical protein